MKFFSSPIKSYQQAPFPLQALFLILLGNLFFFLGKVFVYKTASIYVKTQLSLTILVLFLIIFVVFPGLETYSVSKKNDSSWVNTHTTFYNKFGNIAFLCYDKVKSKWTWLFTLLSFGHAVFISAYALVTWHCPNYVRITFILSFVFFIWGLIALKIQNKPSFNHPENIANLETPKIPALSFIQTQQHPFHILPPSMWPFFTAYFAFDLLFFTVRYLHYGLTSYTQHHLMYSLFALFAVLNCWFWNIANESNEGFHTKKVRWNLLHGFMLFILSEIMLFFAIFWAFFHSSLAPTVAIYCVWPPLGIQTIEPWHLPLFNTAILLTSGISLTYAHRALLHRNFALASNGLLITLVLGGIFTCVQGFEYIHAPFSINDGIYGSVFYFATGFHGLHVIVGSLMLLVSLIRNGLRELFLTQHVGFTCAIWYWHFVDVVWIFLFITIYWWGS